MNSKKYEITSESKIDNNGNKVYRIRALRGFGNVKPGDQGGFVQSSNNLSHDGNCWIYDNAVASEDALVCDNAKMYLDGFLGGSDMLAGNDMYSNRAFVPHFSHNVRCSIIAKFSFVSKE